MVSITIMIKVWRKCYQEVRSILHVRQQHPTVVIIGTGEELMLLGCM